MCETGRPRLESDARHAASLSRFRNSENIEHASFGSKVILTWVNGNVIMSGCGDDNPDDAGREPEEIIKLISSKWK
jgi:hypothetical protein